MAYGNFYRKGACVPRVTYNRRSKAWAPNALQSMQRPDSQTLPAHRELLRDQSTLTLWPKTRTSKYLDKAFIINLCPLWADLPHGRISWAHGIRNPELDIRRIYAIHPNFHPDKKQKPSMHSNTVCLSHAGNKYLRN